MQTGKDTSGNTIPLWFSAKNAANYPTLNTNISCDVCIIGAGIAGLTSAYCLLAAGKSVVVLEDGKVASGESGRTSAHLSNALDDRYYNIINVHGVEKAKLAAQSHTAAIDFIEKIVISGAIDCDFKRLDGYLFLGKNGGSLKTLQKELEACHQVGLSNVILLEQEPNHTFNMGPCLVFPQQAQFHPLKYLNALAQIITKNGGKIFELTHVKDIQSDKPAKVITQQNYTVTAQAVIQATNVPINDRYVMHSKQEPNRTYVIAAKIPKACLKTALYWDNEDPYHYIRLQEDSDSHDLLIIGGDDHRTGIMQGNSDPFKNLETWARQYFPSMGEIKYTWSGQVIEPVDYLAFIGHNPNDEENIYIATGDSGNGLTHGTISGMLLTDLILQRDNDWQIIYQPNRKSLKTLKDFISHNLAAATTYLNYIIPNKIKSPEQLKPNEGAIVQQGLKKLAVYRDNTGKLYQCSAICPHLKAILQWNPIEKTWDCPAHGSRFSTHGEVLNSPAKTPLKCIVNNSNNN